MERERRIVSIEYGNRPADSQDTCDFLEHRLRVINVAQQRMCNDGIKRFVGDGDALHISRSEVYSLSDPPFSSEPPCSLNEVGTKINSSNPPREPRATRDSSGG